jgi:hypothetical protein
MNLEKQLWLFNHFTVNHDDYREHMRVPFVCDDIYCATDAHSVIYCNVKDVIGTLPEVHPKTPNVKTILFDKAPPVKVLINQKMFDKYREKGKDYYTGRDTKCEYCDGHKEVTWTFEHYTMEDKCPSCNGSGSTDYILAETDKVLFGRQLVLFEGAYFKMTIFYRIIQALKVIPEDVFYLGKKGSLVMFEIGIYTIILAEQLIEDINSHDNILKIKTS